MTCSVTFDAQRLSERTGYTVPRIYLKGKLMFIFL